MPSLLIYSPQLTVFGKCYADVVRAEMIREV